MNDKKLQEVIGRVVDEQTLLEDKIQKLVNFLNAPSGYPNDMNPTQRRLLIIQLGIMQSYSTVLKLRLDNLNGIEI